MFEHLEQDILKHREEHIILQEYGDIVTELKGELEICKTEQNNIRFELGTLYAQNKDSSDAIRDYISHIHLEECNNEDVHQKIIFNLKERIAILQMEKDSAVQLWHISMKAVDTLEQELRTCLVDGNDVKFHEERLKDVKQLYSQAIKTLENKLLQARENFIKQQSLWMNSEENRESLKKEKQEITKKLQDFQQDAEQKGRNAQKTIELLTLELSTVKAEMQKTNDLKLKLEKQLSESKRIANNVMLKNEETKCKMAEALDIIEAAVKEKDILLQREAEVVEQKNRLEIHLTSIKEKHTNKMQEEITKLKDVHERDLEKYLLEIKGLKSELREKITLLDRLQRESRLVEFERIHQDSENLLLKSSMNNLNFEQLLKHTDSKLQDDGEYRKQHYLELQQLEEKITHLEEKLTASNEKLEQIQHHQNPIDIRGYIKLADEKTKDTIDHCANLESQLIKAADDKNSLIADLKSLQSAFDHEMQKRDYERHTLENKIHELEDLQKTYYIMKHKLENSIPSIDVSSNSRANMTNKHALDIHVENVDYNWQSILSEQLSKPEKNFEKKMKEMVQHVTMYQKLSRRWREEAKSLTTRFQIKSKEQHRKIKSLQKENLELQKTILIYQQFPTRYKTNGINSYMQGSETR